MHARCFAVNFQKSLALQGSNLGSGLLNKKTGMEIAYLVEYNVK